MKILIRNSDNVVIYADDSITLTDKAQSSSWVDYNFNSTNATIVDAELPILWSGAVWSYINGVWAVVDTVRHVELLDGYKADKKQLIKQDFLQASLKPIVDTGLGFSVDGSYQNKTDFETGKKYSLPQVRASDNTMHNVTLADYDTIISAIEQNGIALYQRKWIAESLIDSATTEAEVSAVTF